MSPSCAAAIIDVEVPQRTDRADPTHNHAVVSSISNSCAAAIIYYRCATAMAPIMQNPPTNNAVVSWISNSWAAAIIYVGVPQRTDQADPAHMQWSHGAPTSYSCAAAIIDYRCDAAMASIMQTLRTCSGLIG